MIRYVKLQGFPGRKVAIQKFVSMTALIALKEIYCSFLYNLFAE